MFDHFFDHITYPAGEMQVRLRKETLDKMAAGEKPVGVLWSTWPFRLEGVLLGADALANKLGREIDLFLPYLPYARADRRFVDGDCCGMDVFMRALASAPIRSVHTIDVHSQVAVEHWPQFLVNYLPTQEIADVILKELNTGPGLYVLFPDEGAHQRYALPLGNLIKNWTISGRIRPDQSVVFYSGSKKRDLKTGQFLGFEVPDACGDFPILIVDDLCDAGGTFIHIGRELREKQPERRISLYVTHGIFSQGTNVLRTWGCIDGTIYTTDTWRQTGLTGAHPFGRDGNVVVLPAAERISAEIVERIRRINAEKELGGKRD